MDAQRKQEVYINNRYIFFYANLCHVCKKFNSDTALKQCSGCRMIVYCSREHQELDWSCHKDICTAIQQVRKTCTAIASASHLTPDTMKVLKEMMLQIMNRPLFLYETHMLKYPRMCLACYKITGGLKECPNCRTVWFCEQHANNRHSSTICNLLKLCLESDLSLFHNRSRPSLIDAYMRSTSYDKHFRDMEEFINIYGDIEKVDSESSRDILKIEQSVYLTIPLSVYHGMYVSGYISTYKKQKTLVLYVIAMLHFEEYLPAWELLLHIFSKVQTLKLVLLGMSQDLEKIQNVCENCKRKKKTFLVELFDTSAEEKAEPDLAIIFANESRGDFPKLYTIWISTVLTIKRNCPLIFCYSNVNTTINRIINTPLDKTIEVRKSDNPFASLKPNRAYELPPFPVFYENMYVNVYETSCT